MRRRRIHNRLRSLAAAFALTFGLIFAIACCVLLLSCSLTPDQDQFVTHWVDQPVTRSRIHCSETSLHDFSETDDATQELSTELISILSWNIYKEQKKGWQADLNRFSREADIILLQEASLHEKLRRVLEEKRLYWTFNSGFKYKGIESGVLLASRIKPLASCGQRVSEPVIRLPKTVLISRFRLAVIAEDLLVANIHAINITLGTGAYQQQMTALKEKLSTHDGPIVLAGDFNNWSTERSAIMVELIAELGLQTLLPEEDFRTKFLGTPVDQILFRGLKPVRYAVHPVTSSDHNPISITFRVARLQ